MLSRLGEGEEESPFTLPNGMGEASFESSDFFAHFGCCEELVLFLLKRLGVCGCFLDSNTLLASVTFSPGVQPSRFIFLEFLRMMASFSSCVFFGFPFSKVLFRSVMPLEPTPALDIFFGFSRLFTLSGGLFLAITSPMKLFQYAAALTTLESFSFIICACLRATAFSTSDLYSTPGDSCLLDDACCCCCFSCCGTEVLEAEEDRVMAEATESDVFSFFSGDCTTMDGGAAEAVCASGENGFGVVLNASFGVDGAEE